MKVKKILASAMALALAFGLMACGNTENEATKNEETGLEESTSDKEETKEEESTFDSPIYDVKYNYLPEKFGENFRDEKDDLLTIEFGQESNPAKKITVQLSDNQERFKDLFDMPEDAEDVKLGEESGKFWDDGSFNYLVVDRKDYSIYARSTLDKEETIKVVEEAK